MVAGDVAAFDRFARWYALCMPAARADYLARAIGLADRPVERLVDLGGGPGRAASALEADERFVVDAAGGMVRQARRNDLLALQGDAGRLPLDDGTLDAITITDALHHMYDWDRVVTESWRTLRPGGVLAISDFDPTTLAGRALERGERWFGFDSRFAPPDRLCGRLESAGFETHVVDDGFAYTVAGVVPEREGKNPPPSE
jgi:ubiquinone/menaquinone biosynthesis C-methylase UbiE